MLSFVAPRNSINLPRNVKELRMF